jgi:integrase/recombinase XerC
MTPNPMTPKTSDVEPLNSEQLFERILRLSVADGTASQRTLDAYREGLALYLAWCESHWQSPHLGSVLDPRRATFDDIQQYRRWLGERYKRSTIKLRLTAVRLLYTAMQRWGVRQDNPAAGVRAPRADSTKTAAVLRKCLSPQEAVELNVDLSLLPSGALEARDNCMIGLMLYHGLRAGEISRLEDEDADLATFRRIRVLGKGGKEREILLIDRTAELLRHWIANGHGQPDFVRGHHPLFYRLDRHGREPLSVRSIERAVDRRLQDLGLKQAGRSAHALRHTFAVMATLGGAGQQALAEVLGHADIRTTDVYTRAAAAFQSNPAEKAEAIFKDGPKVIKYDPSLPENVIALDTACGRKYFSLVTGSEIIVPVAPPPAAAPAPQQQERTSTNG